MLHVKKLLGTHGRSLRISEFMD